MKAYADTPSRFAVVAAINEQRQLICRCSWILADNFRPIRVLINVSSTATITAVVLISASSSGSLAARLIDEKNVEPQRIVHLLYLGAKPRAQHRSFVTSLKTTRRTPPDSRLYPQPTNPWIAQCAKEAHTLSSSGVISSSSRVLNRMRCLWGSPMRQRPFGADGRYACAEVFEVGLGRSGLKMPRLFHINANKLLQSAEFGNKLDYALRRSLPARLSQPLIAADQQSQALTRAWRPTSPRLHR